MAGTSGTTSTTTSAPAHAVGSRLYHTLVPMLTGERQDLPARLVIGTLVPLALLYSAGLKVYLWPYHAGLRRRHRLPCCVVSVGNLVSGGTGKTGLTVTLARSLRDAGYRVCVLSRGFRGSHEGQAAIVSTGEQVLLGAEEAGDEPFLMATELQGVPVLVGRDRRVTGQLAVSRFKPDVVLLDDGAQYYQLHQDVRILILAASRPFGNGWTLPAGVLREPPSHVRRATCVVVYEDVPGRTLNSPTFRALASLPVYRGRYEATGLTVKDTSQRRELPWLRGRRVAAVSALGNPASFENTLRTAGAIVVSAFRFPDHARPDPRTVAALLNEAVLAEAEAIVMTRKDAVKWPRLDSPLPVLVLEAEFRVDRLKDMLRTIEEVINSRAQGGIPTCGV